MITAPQGPGVGGAAKKISSYQPIHQGPFASGEIEQIANWAQSELNRGAKRDREFAEADVMARWQIPDRMGTQRELVILNPNRDCRVVMVSTWAQGQRKRQFTVGDLPRKFRPVRSQTTNDTSSDVAQRAEKRPWWQFLHFWD